MMKCEKVLDVIYESDDLPPFAERLALALHILFCGHCALSLRHYENARELLKTAFIPPSPDFEDSIMEKIYAELDLEEEKAGAFDIPGGFSTRGWVVAGFILIVSLATAFFGSDFINMAARHGSSFLIPVGIIVGIIVTAYSTLFIGSHLKEFSERFRLR